MSTSLTSIMSTVLSSIMSMVSYNVLHCYSRLALDIRFYKRLASSSPVYGTGCNQQYARQILAIY